MQRFVLGNWQPPFGLFVPFFQNISENVDRISVLVLYVLDNRVEIDGS